MDNIMDESGNEQAIKNVGGAAQAGAGSDYYQLPTYPELPPTVYDDDWKYKMRRSMQEIIPGLFLGPYASATTSSLEAMKTAGLTHVICVRQFLEQKLIRPNHLNHFQYLVVEVADTLDSNIISHFKSINSFLDECVQCGGKALIHGNTGTSRSAALVVARLMWLFGTDLEETYRFVQTKRFCININEGFKAQLHEYEPMVKAHHTVPLVALNATNGNRGTKRSTEEDETAKNDDVQQMELL